jgi:hypothetical protein
MVSVLLTVTYSGSTSPVNMGWISYF